MITLCLLVGKNKSTFTESKDKMCVYLSGCKAAENQPERKKKRIKMNHCRMYREMKVLRKKKMEVS